MNPLLSASMQQASFKCEMPQLELKSLRRILAIKRCQWTKSENVITSLTPKSVPAETKTPSSPVCYVGIVQLFYARHISHPTKTTTMVKPLPLSIGMD